MAGNTRAMGRSVGWQTHLCRADKGCKFLVVFQPLVFEISARRRLRRRVSRLAEAQCFCHKRSSFSHTTSPRESHMRSCYTSPCV
jgi:hypothetical protein